MQLQLLINFLDLLLKRSFILHTGTCIMSLNQAKLEAQVQRIWFKCGSSINVQLLLMPNYLSFIILHIYISR